MVKLSYFINKKIVYVFIDYKDIKNMYLKIKKGHIYCLAPRSANETVIKHFVDKHIEKFAKFLEKKQDNPLYSLTYDFLIIQGKKYFFKRLSGFSTSSIELYSDKLFIKTNNSSDSSVKLAIREYLCKQMLTYLENSLPAWEKKMSLQRHSFEIVDWKTIWGQNMINMQRLLFSLKLYHFDSKVIDYVIVHELAHSIQPNHSQVFWNVVEKYMPNYLKYKKMLKDDNDLNDL